MQYVSRHDARPEDLQLGAANSLYARACGRGLRGQFRSLLTGQSRCLLALASVKAARGAHAHCDAELQMVPLDQIRGSEDRVGDFDCDFYPLHDYNKDRWLRVALARQQGKELPPVALVQVGDVYFVRDGHHRISVARALGQRVIEAKVVVWQVEGSLPGEESFPGQETVGLGWLYKKAREYRAGFRERFLPEVRDLLIPPGVGVKTRMVS